MWLRKIWCWLVGHRREYYTQHGVMYCRCKCCKRDMLVEFDKDLFGW